MITIYLAGTPRPQPRARHVQKGRARFTVSTASPHAKAYRAQLVTAMRLAAQEASEAPLPAGGVGIKVEWFFATRDRARWGRLHTPTPDVDNLEKMVLDAAQAAGLLTNDSRVARVHKAKLWASTAGTVIEIDYEPADGLLEEEDGEDVGAFVGA
jgi:Holliday junction resolvase RusA-like endonuclease